MWKFWKQFTVFAALAAAAGLECGSAALAAKPGGGESSTAAYAIIPFLPPGASVSSSVSDINDAGHAVGTVEITAGVPKAYHRAANGSYSLLRDGADALCVNNLNQIVGFNGSSAVFWSSPSASPVVLPPLPNDLTSWVEAINDDGIAIGASKRIVEGQEVEVAVVWRVVVLADGTINVNGPVELPPLQAGYSRVMDINEVVGGKAQVVGESAGKAVVWTVGINSNGALNVPNPPVPVGTSVWSIGNGINNFADVCGISGILPFVASADQEPQILSVPSRVFNSSAEAINDGGEIAGYVTFLSKGSQTSPGAKYAYLWKDGERIDLTSQIPSRSGWNRLSSASAINNHGLIGGVGLFDTKYRGFILIPNAP